MKHGTPLPNTAAARRFLSLWQNDETPPDVFEYLASSPRGDARELVDVLLVDLRQRRERSLPSRLDEYLARCETLAADRSLCRELIEADGQRLWSPEGASQRQALARRFPELWKSLQTDSDRTPEVTWSHVQDPTPPPEPETAAAEFERPEDDSGSELGDDSGIDMTPPLVPSLGGRGGSRSGWRPRFADYEVLEEIGRGGMGIVFRARQIGLNRIVALKVIRAGWLADDVEIRRFRAEAEAAAQLDHPHIVPVFEVGEEHDQCFFSMGLVQGRSLDQLDASERSPHEAAGLLLKVARAMHFAHQQGIIHRDLKPSNILLDAQGEPKITDFGLARKLDQGSDLTQTGQAVGTPAYMAPEQAAGNAKAVGPALDVYALGGLLYWLLTGQPPLRGDSVLETLEKVRSEPPVPPSRQRPGIPKDLEAICLKCLAKDPAERYESAAALADDLQRFLDGQAVRARRLSPVSRLVRRVRRRPVAFAAFVLAVGLLAASGWAGYRYWDTQLRTKVEYYGNLAKKWGAWQGVGRLTAEEATRRGNSFKLFRRAGRVQRLEVVTGSGQLTAARNPLGAFITNFSSLEDYRQRVCAYELRYDDAGRVTEEVALDLAGQPVFTFHYTSPTTGLFRNAAGLPSPQAGSGAAYVSIEWDERGHERVVRFLDASGQPKPDGNGAYGFRMEFNELGLGSRAAFFGPHDEPIVDKANRVAGFELRYDSRGLLREQRFLDLQGRLTPNVFGVARIVMTLDSCGNPVEVAALDESGQPTMHKDGYHRMVAEMDVHGNQTAARYYDREGNPASIRLGHHLMRMEYDNHGNPVRVGYYDIEERPTRISLGYHRLDSVFDKAGNLLQESFLDVDLQPALVASGYARRDYEYDDQGRMVATWYFDQFGEPVLHADGNHGYRSRFDRAGNETSRAFFGRQRQPVLTRLGYHREEMTYDGHGNRLSLSYFDAQGQPTWSQDGFHRAEYELDAEGRRVGEKRFDVSGELIGDRQGVAHYRYDFDEPGNLVGIRCYGVHGQPVICRVGWHRAAYELDGRRRQTATALFGHDDTPVLSVQEGAHREVVELDRFGNVVQTARYGADGQLTTGYQGFAILREERDALGNVVRIRYLDASGEPAWHPDGVCGWNVRYDPRGWEIERTAVGRKGNPLQVLSRGYATVANVVDPRGNVLRRRYQDPQGRSVVGREGTAGFNHQCDRWGRVERIQYVDPEDQLRANAQGVAQVERRYDSVGNQTSERFLDAAGNPVGQGGNPVGQGGGGVGQGGGGVGQGGGGVGQAGGPAGWTARYDSWGRLTEFVFLDPEENPATVAGCATQRGQWSPRGDQVEQSWFGPSGAPCMHPLGYSRWTSEFDRDGQHVSRTYFDTAGEPLEVAVVVATVFPGSPAEQAGLLPRDIVQRYDGEPVGDALTLAHRLLQNAGREAGPLQVERGGEAVELHLPGGFCGATFTDQVKPAGPQASAAAP